ncbi:MAG: M56 family metallopeptidase, partial [Patescibacteria group bacterium]
MSPGILNKKANLILTQLAVISLFLSGLIGLVVFKFYKYFTFIIKSLLGGIQTICGCQIPVSFTNHPYVITGLFILAVGLLTAILSFIFKSVRIYIKTSRFIKKYTGRSRLISTKLNDTSQQINLSGKVIEIQTEEPAVFCYGFFNPRICISSAIVNSLSSLELKAVLLHEQHHLKVYEPIKLLLVKIISTALFFIPGIKNLTRQYAVFSELAADEAATDNFKNKAPLAQALNKILAQKENMLIQKGLAISFFSQVIEERVNKLVDNNYIPSVKFNFIKLLSSVFVIGIFFFTAKTLPPHFFPTEQKTGDCALTEQNLPLPNMWITTGLTNKPTPTTL